MIFFKLEKTGTSTRTLPSRRISKCLICCLLHVCAVCVTVGRGDQWSRATGGEGLSHVTGWLSVCVCPSVERRELSACAFSAWSSEWRWQSGPPGSATPPRSLPSCHRVEWQHDKLFPFSGAWEKRARSVFHRETNCLSVFLWQTLKLLIKNTGVWGFPGYKVNPCCAPFTEC